MKKTLKKLSIIVLLLVACSISPTVINAQEQEEASNSASFENIKKIIKENIQNSKVKGAIDNLINRKMALIGEVTRVTDETITLNGRTGTRIIPLNDTLSITKDDKIIKISDIAVENWLLVLGKIKDDDFSPIFLEVNTKSLLPKSQFVTIGTVTKNTSTTITVIPRSSDTEKEIIITKNTTFEGPEGEKINESQITEDLTVLITGYSDNDKFEASTIHSLAKIESND